MQGVALYPGIVADPQILGGTPISRGTRVPVMLVLGKLTGEMSLDELRPRILPE